MELQVGMIAPGFVLIDQDGIDRRLSDYRGRRVIVYFYPEYDTPGDAAEACQFDDMYDELNRFGVDVVGISSDDTNTHLAFHNKYQLRFKLLTDVDNTVASAYGVVVEKVRWTGKRTHGIVRSTFVVGAEGELLHLWYDVSPYGHADTVRAALAGRGNEQSAMDS